MKRQRPRRLGVMLVARPVIGSALFAALALLAMLAVCDAGAWAAGKVNELTGQPASQPSGPPPFIVGVFAQPADSFDLWKARGINTLIGYEGESGKVSVKDWSDRAVDEGLYFMRQPSPDMDDDLDQAWLLAWMHADEPDVKKPPTDPSVLADETAHWRNASRAGVARTGKDIAIFVNFSGGNILFHKTPRETYDAYLKTTDWVGSDFYPVTGWSKPAWLDRVGEIVETLRDWSGNKPQLAFIECSAQRLPWTPKDAPGPTAGQMRVETWDAIIHGVIGIVYFPQQIGWGFQYDATPPSCIAEMVRTHRMLKALGDVMKPPANPQPIDVKVLSPLEAGWRIKGDTAYFFVLNTSDEQLQNQKIQVKGWSGKYALLPWEDNRPVRMTDGVMVDDFDKYELHVYVVKKG